MEKDNFKSKIGVVAATAGSAVGLGNLWAFSYKAGTNGGGTFVLIYLFAVLFVGVPVMLTEFVIGREGKSGPVGSIENITGNKKSPFVLGGYSGVLSTFLILSFYGVIAGWAINYLVHTLIHGFSEFAVIDASDFFTKTTSNLPVGIFYQSLFMLITAFIVVLGVQKGIERMSKIMMPMLFAIIILLALYCITLPGFSEAVSFLFVPSPLPEGTSIYSVATSALGQAFFSLSLGMGAIITYGKAVSDDMDINTITLQVVICDTLVALLAGLAIFPIIFSTPGLGVTAGPGLAFMALPVAFASMPAGYIIGNAFFLLLIIAALTSSISLLESSATLVLEKTTLGRKTATIISAVAITAFGFLSQLGLGFSSKLLAFTGEVDFLDQLDKLTTIYLIPFGALMLVILVGYRMDPNVVRKQINNEKIANIFIPYVKYVAPVLVCAILVCGILGL